MTRKNVEVRARPEGGFGLAAAQRARSAVERKPWQEVAARCGEGHNDNRNYPNWRRSFPSSARLGIRRVVMREENGSRLFAPERYRAYLHLLARLNLPRRLRGALSASDLAHDTILKAHKNRAQFRGQTEAEYRAWLQRILANRIADAARGKEPEILQAL